MPRTSSGYATLLQADGVSSNDDTRTGALMILEDFRWRLERSDARIADAFDGLDRRIAAYRATTASFCGSTVARITGLRSPRPRS